MEITLNVSEAFTRKLKALQNLTGHSIDQIEYNLGSILEQAVADKILNALDLEAPTTTTMAQPTITKKKVSSLPMNEVVSELGDVDPSYEEPQEESQEIEGATEPEAMVPDEGGLTDEILDHDMSVENSETEAASDASSMLGSELQPVEADQAEEVFAQAAFGNDDTWGDRRRKKIKLRGKVSMGSGSDSEEL